MQTSFGHAGPLLLSGASSHLCLPDRAVQPPSPHTQAGTKSPALTLALPAPAPMSTEEPSQWGFLSCPHLPGAQLAPLGSVSLSPCCVLLHLPSHLQALLTPAPAWEACSLSLPTPGPLQARVSPSGIRAVSILPGASTWSLGTFPPEVLFSKSLCGLHTSRSPRPTLSGTHWVTAGLHS